MFARREISLVVIIGLFAAGACNRDLTAEPNVNKSSTGIQNNAPEQETKAAVERIVFIGKKNACDCTRKQIDTTWKALQSALEGGPEIAVKRLQVDVDVDEANQYHAMQPLMALPGVYFFDGKKQLTKLLQGELRVDELAQVLP